MERLRIKRLGHRGDGIAPGPVFVPGTLPGEEVEGVVSDGIMISPRILVPSDQRVRSPCAHAKSCGGCQLQHAHDDFTTAWKQDVVRAALHAHGLGAPIRACHTSPPGSRRRATFSARRTKKGAMVGFHMKGSDVLVQVTRCQLVRPSLRDALPMVEALAIAGASRKGEVSVTVTDSLGGLDVSVQGGKPMDAALRATLAEIARLHDVARLSWDDDTLLRRAPEQEMGSARVTPPPGAFLQATSEGEAALLAGVTEVLDGAKTGIDLFAGCGTFTLPLARDHRMHAVEGDAAMMEALDHAVRNTSGLKPVTHETRDLFRNPLLSEDLAQYNGAIIDPPRAGAAAQVAELARARVPRIAHVSCSPTTFARDTAALVASGYSLEWIDVVDQFRWSTHVELVAGLYLRG